MPKKQDNQKIKFNFEVSEGFFEELHTIMDWVGREPDSMVHLRNALELYAVVIEGMAKGKILALVEPNGKNAEKVYLPSLLAQFKYEKEMEYDKNIDLKKQLL